MTLILKLCQSHNYDKALCTYLGDIVSSRSPILFDPFNARTDFVRYNMTMTPVDDVLSRPTILFGTRALGILMFSSIVL